MAGYIMKSVYIVLGFQLGATVLAAFILGLIFGLQPAVSGFLGGVCALVPTAVFGRRLFSASHAHRVHEILRSFYRGELWKIGLTTLLFFVCIQYIHVSFLPFMVTYILCQSAFWIVPWFPFKHKVISA